MKAETENNSNYTEEEKNKAIKKEILKLKKIYKDIDKEKFNTVLSLLEEAAFMTITLKDLRETVNREGTKSTYQNGENQWGTKPSVEYDQYLKTIDKHMKAVKQLADLLPNHAPKPKSDGFDEFIAGREDVD